VRGEPQHFTSSKVMCWVALDRGAKLAACADDASAPRVAGAPADEIKADILEHGVDERGVFTPALRHDALDASLLLMPLVRFLPPTTRASRDRAGDRRRADRGRPGAALPVEETDDGLSGEEGTFTICSFWLVSALARSARPTARKLCEKLLSYASPLQLYAEEIDPRTGRHLGNFPQAFTHLALINATARSRRRSAGSPRPVLSTVSPSPSTSVTLAAGPAPRRAPARVAAALAESAGPKEASGASPPSNSSTRASSGGCAGTPCAACGWPARGSARRAPRRWAGPDDGEGEPAALLLGAGRGLGQLEAPNTRCRMVRASEIVFIPGRPAGVLVVPEVGLLDPAATTRSS
jgi:hypothetical protein